MRKRQKPRDPAGPLPLKALPGLVILGCVLMLSGPPAKGGPGAAAKPAHRNMWRSPQEAAGKPRSDPGDELGGLEDQIARNQMQTVLPALTRYVRDHADSARAHYDLGYVLFRLHQIGDSVKELSRSLELDVNNGEAHKILGLDCTIVGRYDLAETELEQAARLEPRSAEIHYWLGRLYYTRGVYPLAEREFEAALRWNPSYMKAYNNLGLVEEALGRSEEAAKYYRIAVRLDQQQGLKSPWPYEYLSAFYNRQQQPQRALDYARQALSINPRSDLAYFQMAKAYEYEGEWGPCAEAARKAIAVNSRTSSYYYLLSLALRKLGRLEESRAALQTFEKLEQNETVESERWREARQADAGASPIDP
jgi:tetratricopeptide (TPR) repeat protein